MTGIKKRKQSMVCPGGYSFGINWDDYTSCDTCKLHVACEVEFDAILADKAERKTGNRKLTSIPDECPFSSMTNPGKDLACEFCSDFLNCKIRKREASKQDSLEEAVNPLIINKLGKLFTELVHKNLPIPYELNETRNSLLNEEE